MAVYHLPKGSGQRLRRSDPIPAIHLLGGDEENTSRPPKHRCIGAADGV